MDRTDKYSTVNRTDEFSIEYTVKPTNEYSCTSQGLSPGQVCLRLYIFIETLNRYRNRNRNYSFNEFSSNLEDR